MSARKWYVAFGAMLLASLIVNVTLARRLELYKSEITGLSEVIVELKRESRLGVGQSLPPLEGETATGEAWRLDYDAGQPTLLYVYSPTCVWCTRNLENIRTLARSTEREVRVIGLSVAAAQVEARRQDVETLGFPILFQVDEAGLEAYRIGGTPQTYLISEDGVLVRNWTGAYSGPLSDEIESYFDIELPGLTGAS